MDYRHITNMDGLNICSTEINSIQLGTITSDMRQKLFNLNDGENNDTCQTVKNSQNFYLDYIDFQLSFSLRDNNIFRLSPSDPEGFFKLNCVDFISKCILINNFVKMDEKTSEFQDYKCCSWKIATSYQEYDIILELYYKTDDSLKLENIPKDDDWD